MKLIASAAKPIYTLAHFGPIYNASSPFPRRRFRSIISASRAFYRWIDRQDWECSPDAVWIDEDRGENLKVRQIALVAREDVK